MGQSRTTHSHTWVALAIGNSRLHWAVFLGDVLHRTWDTPYFSDHDWQQWSEGQLDPDVWPLSELPSEIWVASVVPEQTMRWQEQAVVKLITLDQVPVLGLYPTMGVDRALALYAAGTILGWPILVIDAGTALTVTGANRDQQLVGGAILPGLKLQFQSLAAGTAQLPHLPLTEDLPPRWARNTTEAIQSGILYTLLAGLADFVSQWWYQYPGSGVVLTGGDAELLLQSLHIQYPAIAVRLHWEPTLVLRGIQQVRQHLLNSEVEWRDQSGQQR